MRSAALAFRADDVEVSVSAAVHVWWTSRLHGRRFVQLVQQARAQTQARISVGGVGRGEPGRREAMPYFFAVLRDLVTNASGTVRPQIAEGTGQEQRGVIRVDVG
jgi:hypothetical protein